MARAERQDDGQGGSDYIDKYREFKYQEALFDIFVKQFELAKVDESREGALIQVVDVAQPPDSRPGPSAAGSWPLQRWSALLAACGSLSAPAFVGS